MGDTPRLAVMDVATCRFSGVDTTSRICYK
jgi:hypothetical protein